MGKIRHEMEHARQDHRQKMEELDKKLLDSRIKLQKEAEVKIKSMESAAHDVIWIDLESSQVFSQTYCIS